MNSIWNVRRRRWALRPTKYAVAMLVLGGLAAIACTSQWRRHLVAQRLTDLNCLAKNVYFEARGEPLVGQYAVAEVTMNRVVSPQFPDSVCEVVYESHWNDRRKRAVGAFSWTELENVAPPSGLPWQRAQAVAATVYDNIEAPLVDGALFYHATRVSPAWAHTRPRVAHIGAHLFYR